MPLTPTRLALLALVLATTSACSASEEELDCFTLGGGYEGEDLEALQAECEADSRGTDCEASAFIESDAAKCLAVGAWSEEIDREYSAGLFYSYGDRSVMWSIPFPAEGALQLVHATTGETSGFIYVTPP